MIKFFIRLFIQNPENIKDIDVRRNYGKVCSITGIGLNILLFIGKYIAGFITGSVAIMADSFNNLSDAGSSVITLLGFHLAEKKPDPEHPFGHGRIEYVSGLIVAMLIVIMGVELLQTSFQKIFHATKVEINALAIVILILSIFVKIYMAYYNHTIGKKINSSAMNAIALDSLSDVLATTVVLISMIIMHFTGWNLDGISGVFVALFILRAGAGAASETVQPLLGQPPEPEFVEEVRRIVLSHDKIHDIHDLIVHDYGPGRCMISLHAEVPGNEDIFELHDMIDLTEYELKMKLNCEAVIHMDPLAIDDECVNEMKQKVVEVIKKLDERLNIHDFRMLEGPTHTNVMFDIVVPYNMKMSDTEVQHLVFKSILEAYPNVYSVITVDRSYV